MEGCCRRLGGGCTLHGKAGEGPWEAARTVSRLAVRMIRSSAGLFSTTLHWGAVWAVLLLLLPPVTLAAPPSIGVGAPPDAPSDRLSAPRQVEQLSPCTVRVDGRVINLAPLARTDGSPRYRVEHAGWNYTFNPCTSFNLPAADPHSGRGDRCPYVAMCKSRQYLFGGAYYYTAGIQSQARFHSKMRMYQRYVRIAERLSESESESESNSELEGGEVSLESEEGQKGEVSSESSEGSGEVSSESEQGSFEDYGVSSYSSSEEEAEQAAEDAFYEYYGPSEPELEAHNSSKDDTAGHSTTEAPGPRTIDQRRKRMGGAVIDNTGETRAEDGDGLKSELLIQDNVKRRSRRDDDGNKGDEENTGLDHVEYSDGSLQHGDRAKRVSSHEKVVSISSQNDTQSQNRTLIVKINVPKLKDSDLSKGMNGGGRRKNATINAEKNNTLSDKTVVPFGEFLPDVPPDAVMLSFRGLQTLRRHRMHVILVCDYNRWRLNDGKFTMVDDKGFNMYFELAHRCCCPDACVHFTSLDAAFNLTAPSNNGSGPGVEVLEELLVENGPRHLWLVLVINGGILACAILIGGACCRKGGGGGAGGYYNMLPASIPRAPSLSGLHGSRLTINGIGRENDKFGSQYVSTHRINSPEYLDYSSAMTRKQQQPLSDNGIIDSRDLEIGQRLGGGLFGDTYMAEFKERRVAAKRITVGVHQSQLTEDDLDYIVKEIVYFSKQKHKNVASVLGCCTDTRQPYVISEFVEGEALKELLLRGDDYLTWPRSLKMCLQTADALAFLHSAKHPILHRDLRAANILVDAARHRIRVVDYGMVKLIQRLRQKCTGHEGCYCQKELSALPATIRWSAPEVLFQPTCDEYHWDVLTPAADMYSLGMVLWEVATGGLDPFDEVADELEVMELVKAGGRPSLDAIEDLTVPAYREMMRNCWMPDPDDRPTCKQVAHGLKQILNQVGKVKNRSRNDSSTTSFLKSALNIG